MIGDMHGRCVSPLSPHARSASVSIDLDEIPCYEAIHGISVSDQARQAVYEKGLPRFLDLLGELNIPSTLFVIGSDLNNHATHDILKQAHAAHHELASHSFSHAYDLSRWTYTEQLADLKHSATTIENLCGERPRGFRAPGYTLSTSLVQAIRDAGFSYDSSVFPCPAYFAAKLAVLTWMTLRGRKSHSVASGLKMGFAKTQPHTLTNGLNEFPIAVTRWLRLPVIGTSLALAGSKAPWLVQGVTERPMVNLEFHGIDLLDANDGLADLAPYQPDLRIPWPQKRAIYQGCFTHLKNAGFTFATLANQSVAKQVPRA